jgi:regulatory protein
MAVITQITVQQKQKDRYNIYIDDGNGEKYAFSVDEAVFIQYKLKKGMELDEFTMTEILFQDDIHKAYSFAVKFLAVRMRSELEVTNHLQKKGVVETIIREVIHKLKKQQYINDQEFANAYVRTQMNTSDKGPVVIRQELKQKGMTEAIIEEALQEYPYEKQLEQAIACAEKFFRKKQDDSSKAIKQKLELLLVRKGFPFEIIHEAIREIDLENSGDQEKAALRKQGEKLISKYKRYSGDEFLQKMKQALYRKGFSLELIDEFLTEIRNEE